MDLREPDHKMKPIVLLLLAAAVISVIGSTGVAYAAEGDAARHHRDFVGLRRGGRRSSDAPEPVVKRVDR